MKKECLILGGLVPDVYYNVSRWPDRGQDGFLSDETVVVGGCAVNMAVTAENLGVRAHVVSCVGDDEVAKMLAEYLGRHALSDRFVRRTEGASGKCFVFVEPDGERTFLTQKGAEGLFPEELAEAILADDYAAAGVTGYYLLNDDAERIMEVIEVLHERGTNILFDPSPLVGAIRRDLLKRMIDISDVMTPNVTELAVLEEAAGRTLIGEDGGESEKRAEDRALIREDGGEPEKKAVEIAGQELHFKSALQEGTQENDPILIVKNGASGGTVYTSQGNFSYEAEKCSAVDTTGAGDSFSGALLYSMVNHLDVTDAVRLAAKCAAKTVTILGPHGFWKLED